MLHSSIHFLKNSKILGSVWQKTPPHMLLGFPWVNPDGKVRHKFVKNCAIHKYFGTNIKNCTIVTWKTVAILHKVVFFCIHVPIYLTILKCPFLEKNCLKHGHFSGREVLLYDMWYNNHVCIYYLLQPCSCKSRGQKGSSGNLELGWVKIQRLQQCSS